LSRLPVETVLVTGGTGFIAGWCIVELLRRGYTVRATVRNLSKEAAVRTAIRSAVDADDRLAIVAADLTSDEGWDAAAAGCDYVLHVASPLGSEKTGDPNDLIAPARDGTLRVLRAATTAGAKRVVMTSAAAAARPPFDSGRAADETIWADPADPQFDTYRVSKILAERAAWDFMNGRGSSTSFTTVLPGAVFGPVLTTDHLGSARIIQRLLDGNPSGIPRLGFSVIDVRDLADLHLRAMTAAEAAGQRFIAAGEFVWMEDIARTLRTRLGTRAGKVPTRTLPNFAVRFLSLFVPSLRTLTPALGRANILSADKARRLLGFTPRDVRTTVVDCAESLLADRRTAQAG
jgi:dihydroflavonol-4-reductase